MISFRLSSALVGSLFLALTLSCQRPSDEGATQAIFSAAQQGDLETLRTLLQQQPAWVNAQNEEGASLVHLAVGAGHAEVLSLLIASGADVNATLPNGRTALHLTDDPTLIQFLLSSGADAHLQDSRGRSPLRATLNVAWRFAGLRAQKMQALTAFLDAGVLFPTEGEEGRYFLHTASMIGLAPLTAHLIENGADVQTLNDSGGTLLHSVAAGGLAQQAVLLLQDGFEADAKNRYGLTPLFLAAMEGHPQVVQNLLEEGATAAIESPAGKNAADFASVFGHEEIAQLLQRFDVRPNPRKRTTLSGAYLGMTPPGLTPELFAPGVVSTVHYDHSAPVFSAQNDEVYWSPVYTSRGDYILSMKQQAGTWSAPQIEPFCEVGGTYMYPTLSPDGTKLFFTSDRPVPRHTGDPEMNIWFVERKPDGWSEPQLVGFTGGHEYGLSISGNGALYFMADYDGGEGSTDLYRAPLVDGQYTAPENLGPVINSASYEDEPFIAPDESYLLFASLRPQPPGTGTLYLSLRNEDTSWTPPVNISSRLNMTGDLRFPRVSPDGNYFFFGSNQNGNWDIYWVDVAVLSDLLEGPSR